MLFRLEWVASLHRLLRFFPSKLSPSPPLPSQARFGKRRTEGKGIPFRAGSEICTVRKGSD